MTIRRAVSCVAAAMFGVSCTSTDNTAPERGSSATLTSGAAATSTVTVAPSTETVRATVSTTPSTSQSIVEGAGMDLTRFPPPQLPLLPATEVAVGPLARLRQGGRWLFGVREPAVLVRIDPETSDVTELDLGIGASRFGPPTYAYVDDTVWLIGGPLRAELIAVDPRSMQERARIPLDDDHAIAQETSPDELWLTTLNAVRHVDTQTGNAGAPISLPSDPTSIEADHDAAWVSLPGASQVARIDPTTNEVLLIDTDPQPSDILIDDDVVWIAHGPTSSLTMIDRRSAAVIGSVDLDVSAGAALPVDVVGLRPARTGVWAIVQYDGSPVTSVTLWFDRDSMTVRAARTMAVDVTTQVHREDEFWVHRAQAGTIVQVDVANYETAPATEPDELAPPTSPPVTEPAPQLTTEEAAVLTAFEQLTSPLTPPPAVLAVIGDAALVDARTALIELLEDVSDGSLRHTDVSINEMVGTVTFDILQEGRVLIPAQRLDFTRPSNDWVVTTESFCQLAASFAVPCPP